MRYNLYYLVRGEQKRISNITMPRVLLWTETLLLENCEITGILNVEAD